MSDSDITPTLANAYRLAIKLTTEFNTKNRLQLCIPKDVVNNPKLKTSAGRYKRSSRVIELNMHLLGNNPGHFEQTVAHELAHHIIQMIKPSCAAHGREWKQVMRLLGYPPDRTHNLEVEKTRHKVRAYAKCGCRVFAIKTRRFNKIMSGTKYKCAKCNQTLTRLGE